jgi:hypothetical protein
MLGTNGDVWMLRWLRAHFDGLEEQRHHWEGATRRTVTTQTVDNEAKRDCEQRVRGTRQRNKKGLGAQPHRAEWLRLQLASLLAGSCVGDAPVNVSVTR